MRRALCPRRWHGWPPMPVRPEPDRDITQAYLEDKVLAGQRGTNDSTSMDAWGGYFCAVR